MDWVLSGAVVLSGIVIVFLILIILIFMVWATGRLVGGAKRPPASASPSPAAATPKVEGGIDLQTVAVISAAVAAAMEQDAPGAAYTVTSVQRARTSRPIWGFAGMQQNTRPF